MRMSRLAGTRVLVVEDEPVIATQIADELNDHGAIVIGPFADVASALAALRHTTPSAAIVDWWLCEESAAVATATLAAKRIPLIIYTGLSLSPAELASCPEAVVVAKPAPDGALVSQLLRLTRKAAPA